MTQSVLRDDRDGVAYLTLNRPDKLNALNLDVFQALEAHVKDIADGPVRAVVLRGAGRCFSAGHDLGDIATGEKPPRPNYQSHVIEMLADLPVPVISAVHGHCYTGRWSWRSPATSSWRPNPQNSATPMPDGR